MVRTCVFTAKGLHLIPGWGTMFTAALFTIAKIMEATEVSMDGLMNQDVLYIYIYWRRQWHPTPVLLPGKSHGRRSLVGCSPWGREESDTNE